MLSFWGNLTHSSLIVETEKINVLIYPGKLECSVYRYTSVGGPTHVVVGLGIIFDFVIKNNGRKL